MGFTVGNTNLILYWRKTCTGQVEKCSSITFLGQVKRFSRAVFIICIFRLSQGFPHPTPCISSSSSVRPTPSPKARGHPMNVHRGSQVLWSPVPYKAVSQGTWTQMATHHRHPEPALHVNNDNATAEKWSGTMRFCIHAYNHKTA